MPPAFLPPHNSNIPPQSSIAAGQPIEHLGESPQADNPFHVMVEGLDNTVKPGMSVNVTFRFEKAGDTTMAVPVEACPTQIDSAP